MSKQFTNRLLLSDRSPMGNRIGILETPCYPAKYYVGFINGDSAANYYPTHNDTCYFHRDQDAALKAYEDFLKF